MALDSIKICCENRKASHDYYLEDRYEAGLVLKGSEVKSIRQNGITLNESFIIIKNNKVLLKNSINTKS